jgi:uncharacterized protein YdhG (YjbR/CyaY superfamily)
MPEAERVLAERVHAIVTESAPPLSPETWYGMPAYAKDGKVVFFFRSAHKFKGGTRFSASTTARTSTTAPCGRSRSR